MIEVISLVVLVKDTSVPIEELYSSIAKEIKSRGRDYELIFIGNDHSGRCWDQISNLSATDERVSGFCSSEGVAENSMLAAGIEIAKGNVVLETSTDIHTNPRCLGQLLGRIEKSIGTGPVDAAEPEEATLTEQLLISVATKHYRTAA